MNVIETLKKNISIKCILETAFYLLFVLITAYFFFQTTMFEIEWPNNTFDYLLYGMIFVTLLRMGTVEQYSLREVGFMACIFIPFLIAWHRNGWDILFPLFVLIIGMKGINFRTMIQVYFSVKSLLLIITVVCALTGRIENLIYVVQGRNDRISFGFVYPTDFSAQLFFLTLCYIYLRRECLRYIEIMLIAGLGIFVYIACEARWSTVCFFALACILAYYRTCLLLKRRKREKLYPGRWLEILLALVPLLGGISMIGFSVLYTPQNRVLEFLNRLTSLRLSYSKKAIDVYGFSIWGQYIPMQGNGATTAENLHPFYLDSSYISIVLQYGLIVFGVIMLIILWVCFDAVKRHDLIFLIVLASMGVQCMIEQHLPEIAYNPFLWALMADMTNKGNGKIQIGRIKEKWKRLKNI